LIQYSPTNVVVAATLPPKGFSEILNVLGFGWRDLVDLDWA
jgi:hypothetical protein